MNGTSASSSDGASDAWSERIQEMIRSLPDPRWLDGGYTALEIIERRVKEESLAGHPWETALWKRGLTLYLTALYGPWNHDLGDRTEEERVAGIIVMDLLGLGLISAKSALGSLQSGYYSVAFATIRHMAETFLQCLYLHAHPSESKLWLPDPSGNPLKTPGVAFMKKRLKERFEIMDAPVSGHYVDRVYESWDLMSKGSHPTGAGLAQLEWPGSGGNRQFGGSYDRYLTLVGYDHGFSAMQSLLVGFVILERMDDLWREQLKKWKEEISTFRQGLKEDPAVIAFQEKYRSVSRDDGSGPSEA